MPSIRELEPLISGPREELSVEYKDWLDLTVNEHRATLAKAAIALANHGGGFIIIGFAEHGSEWQSQIRPPNVPEITQDAVNAAIRRYATPEFHCGIDSVRHPNTNVEHPVITVPGDLTVPVMSKRDCENVIARNRCYIRKPGPRSEEPQTSEEWRDLLNRCLRAGGRTCLKPFAQSYRDVSNPKIQCRTHLASCKHTVTRRASAGRNWWQANPRNLLPGFHTVITRWVSLWQAHNQRMDLPKFRINLPSHGGLS